jgi:hypothetical protein
LEKSNNFLFWLKNGQNGLEKKVFACAFGIKNLYFVYHKDGF